MPRFVGWTMLLALCACSTAQPAPPAETVQRSGDVRQAAVGSPMLSEKSTTVVVVPLVKTPRVDGLRAEFVYLGLLGADPAGRNTIRVRYEEHGIKGGVEEERPAYRAEVTLDLSRSRVIDFRGWRIGVLDASDSSIRYEILGSPAR